MKSLFLQVQQDVSYLKLQGVDSIEKLKTVYLERLELSNELLPDENIAVLTSETKMKLFFIGTKEFSIFA